MLGSATPWLFAALLSIAQGAAGFSVTIDSSNCTATIFRASLSAFEASTPGAHFSYYYGTPYTPTPATLQPVSLFGAPKRTRTFVIYWVDGLFDSNTSFPLTFDVRNATGQVLRIPDSSELDVQTKQVAVTCKLSPSTTSTSRFGAYTTVAASLTATLSTADQTLAALPSMSSTAATSAPSPNLTTISPIPSSTATQFESKSAPQNRVPTLVGAIVGSILGAALLVLLLLLLCVQLRERNASRYQQRREERHGRSHSCAALFGVRGEGEEEEGNGQTQDEAVWTKEEMEDLDANSPEKPSSAPSTPQPKHLGAFLPAWLAALAANRREMHGALRPPSVNPFEATRSWQASMADAHAQAHPHHDGGGGSSVQLPDGPLFRNPYPILNSTPKFPAAPTPSNARVAQAEEDVDAKSSNRSEYARRFAAAAALASQLAMLLSTHARHARGSLRRRRVALRWDDQVRKEDGRGRSGVGERRDGGLDARGMEEVEKMAGEMTKPYSAVETQSWSQCHSAELASIVRPSSQPLSWAAGTGTFPLVKSTSSPLLDTRQGAAAAISPASQQWTARYIPAGRAHSAGASGGSGGGAAAAAFYARSPVSSSANFPQLAPSSSNGLHPGPPRLASSAATGSHQSGRPAVYHSPPPTVPLRLGYGASAGRFLEVGPALESILSVTSEGTEDTAASAGAARSRIEEEETEAQEDLALVTSAATKMETSAAEPLTRPSSAASNSSQSRYGMIRIKERPTSAASGGGSGSGCGSGSGSGSGASALRQSALTSVASPSVSPTPTLTPSQPLFTRTRSVVGPRPLTTSPATGTTPPATATQTTSEAPGAQKLRTEAAVPAASQQMKTVGARRGMSIPLPAVSSPKAATAAAAAAAASTPAMASATALAAATASASPLSTPLHQYTAEELQAHLLLSGWVIQGEPSPLPQPQPQPPSGQHP
ncbi:hypothetical protein OC835_004443 [Tilletia horrida]|nr:hypothetical protein OC835_004443 [Tilletia horrida]